MVNLKTKKGISLITLVITIIVIIILAASIIFSTQNNNPIKQAEKARLYQDIDNFKSELEVYKQDEYLNKLGKFNPDTIQADNLSLRQEGQVIADKNIYSVIPPLKDSDYKDTDFVVVDGKLVYRGDNKDYQDWLDDTDKVIVDKGSIVVLITSKQKLPIKAGVNVEYNINISSAEGLKQVDQASVLSKIMAVDDKQMELPIQPSKEIKSFSYTDENNLSIQLIINTTSMPNGKYTIKLNKGMMENKLNKPNDEIIDTKDMFEVDSTAPESPNITLSTTSPTNSDVTVTITYPSDAAVKQYKIGDESWIDYTAPFTVSDNCTVYAIAKDSAENQSSESSVNITNIDKQAPESPNITLSTTAPTNSDITVTIAYPSDAAVKQYKIGDESWTNYTAPFTVSDNCTVYAVAKDSAGNQSSESSVNITNIDKQAPTYSSYEIKNITSEGYDVYIYGVSDIGSGINRVQFPSWSDVNGQDDLISEWPTSSNISGQNVDSNTWYYHVNRNNMDYGRYETHIYIYDNVENCTSFATSGADIGSPVPDSPSNLSVTMSSSGYLSISWTAPSSYTTIQNYTITVGSVIKTATSTSIGFSYTTTGDVSISVYATNSYGNGMPVTQNYKVNRQSSTSYYTVYDYRDEDSVYVGDDHQVYYSYYSSTNPNLAHGEIKVYDYVDSNGNRCSEHLYTFKTGSHQESQTTYTYSITRI